MTADRPSLRTELVRLDVLTHEAKDEMLQRTYRLETRIFRQVEPFDQYAQRLFESGAHELWVWLLYDGDEPVGYNVIAYREREFRGASIGVYTANVGLLPAYRRHNRTVSAGLRLAIPRLLKEPRRSLYFHAYLVHPSIGSSTTGIFRPQPGHVLDDYGFTRIATRKSEAASCVLADELLADPVGRAWRSRWSRLDR